MRARESLKFLIPNYAPKKMLPAVAFAKPQPLLSDHPAHNNGVIPQKRKDSSTAHKFDII